MKRFVPWIVAVAVSASCAHNQNLQKPQTQDNFGVRMAKENLWREAMFRFQRAIEIDPGDARAHNNLAVAYEANGDFEKARKEYLEALKLDRSNQYIQKNYSRFVEFLSRNRKRQQQPKTESVASKPAPPATATASAPKPPDATMPPPISDRPVGTEPLKPTAPAPPVDFPQPTPPAPPPAIPPGGDL